MVEKNPALKLKATRAFTDMVVYTDPYVTTLSIYHHIQAAVLERCERSGSSCRAVGQQRVVQLWDSEREQGETESNVMMCEREILTRCRGSAAKSDRTVSQSPRRPIRILLVWHLSDRRTVSTLHQGFCRAANKLLNNCKVCDGPILQPSHIVSVLIPTLSATHLLTCVESWADCQLPNSQNETESLVQVFNDVPVHGVAQVE